jgi:hypothetical protein
MKNILQSLLIIGALAFAANARADVTFGENPQLPLSPYWNPLSPHGTYVYADSFIAPTAGSVLSLGAWLNTQTYDPTTSIKFQLLGSIGGNYLSGPDINNVIATTGAISGMNGSAAFYSGSVSSGSIVAGNVYWFAMDAIGGGGNGSYQTVLPAGNFDNFGSFWYSNNPNGSSFDGSNLQPEFAFQVKVGSAVPDSGSTGILMVFGLAALVALRKRSKV